MHSQWLKLATAAIALSIFAAAQTQPQMTPKLPPGEEAQASPQMGPRQVMGPTPQVPGDPTPNAAQQSLPNSPGVTPSPTVPQAPFQVITPPDVVAPIAPAEDSETSSRDVNRPEKPSVEPVVKPVEAKPVEAKPAESKPTAAKPVATKASTIMTAMKAVGPSQGATAKGRSSKKRATKAVEATPPPAPAPAPAPVPLTPEQMSPTAPQVSYLNGQLTIQSTNATLMSILNAIRQQTGAQIEIPPGTANERVATRVGPGPARDVIASLLAGSSFDYLILGNPDSPGGVQRVILTTKGAGSAPGTNVAGMGQHPATPPAADDTDEEPETIPDSEEANTNPTAPVPVEQPAPPAQNPAVAQQPQAQQPQVQQPQGPGVPVAQPQAGTADSQAGVKPVPPPEGSTAPAASDEQSNGNSSTPQVKTPEQLFQELQKMQQQQQQTK